MQQYCRNFVHMKHLATLLVLTVFILMHISFHPILFPQVHLIQTFNGWCSTGNIIDQRNHQLCQIVSPSGRCWIPGSQGHVWQYPCTWQPSHSSGQPSGSDHPTVSIQAQEREEKDPKPNSMGQIVSSHSYLSVLSKLWYNAPDDFAEEHLRIVASIHWLGHTSSSSRHDCWSRYCPC